MDTTGVKRFLSRTQTLDQIKEISAKAHAATLAGEDTVAITSSGFDGGQGAGQLVVSAAAVGSICEEIIAEREGDSAPRRVIFTRASMAYNGGVN
jgi:hypothetical protein